MHFKGKLLSWKSIWYFFPFRLLLLHVQRNILLLVFWGLMFALLQGWVGETMGIRYLFLEPEYMGNVSFYSFFIIGFALGGFISAFQISSYIINSRNFPFLATLSRPFFKYSLNNSIIPFIFILTYINGIVQFEYADPAGYYLYSLALVVGVVAFNIFMYTYFFAFSRDLKKLLSRNAGKRTRRVNTRRVKTRRPRGLKRIWYLITTPESISKSDIWQVETYLNSPFTVRFARSGTYYDTKLLDDVFRKNHFNSALFQLLTMISLLSLGIFREVPFLQIPAASAVLLTGTVLLMLAGFVRFIFGRWSVVFVFITLFAMNELTSSRILVYTNYAYGLDYEKSPVFYDTDSLANQVMGDKKQLRADMQHHERILSNWKRKVNGGKNKRNKPKIIFTVASGGGSKASYWTMHSLQFADSLLNGELLNHTYMMTGSSGGMIGTAYLREMLWQKQLGLIPSIYTDSLTENSGKDLLNPLMVTMALNDLFIRNGHFTYLNRRYPKDRGYAFEKQLNENTGYVLNKPLVSYAEAEQKAQIPLLVLAPTIINDGRRLIISAQPLSFFSTKIPVKEFDYHPKIEDVEFARLFKDHGSENLTLTTAIRMNATFPFILPPVSLPTVPAIEVMDAGIRDNYGIQSALKYIYTMRYWLLENTDGVILLEVSDGLRSDFERKKDKKVIRNLIEGLLTPVGGIFSNLTTVQIYQNEQFFYYVAGAFNGKLQHIAFDMTDYSSKEISMSLHLTEGEKKKIRDSMNLPWNKKSVKELAEALEVDIVDY